MNQGRFVLLALMIAVLAFVAVNTRADDHKKPEVEYLKSPGTEDMDLPFSAAVRVGNMSTKRNRRSASPIFPRRSWSPTVPRR